MNIDKIMKISFPILAEQKRIKFQSGKKIKIFGWDFASKTFERNFLSTQVLLVFKFFLFFLWKL